MIFLCIELSTRDWDILRKRDFDNMSSYFARKTERIREQEVKKETAATTARSKKTTNISSQDELQTDNGQTTIGQSICSNKLATSEQLASTECLPEAKRIKTAILDD